MAQQKIVMKVCMADEKTRKEAMKIAAGVGGVITSVTVEGADRDQLVVVGRGVDSVKLTRRLRKGMGFFSCTLKELSCRHARNVQIVSVAAVEGKKEEKKEEKKPPPPPPCHCCLRSCEVYEIYEPFNHPCHIL